MRETEIKEFMNNTLSAVRQLNAIKKTIDSLTDLEDTDPAIKYCVDQLKKCQLYTKSELQEIRDNFSYANGNCYRNGLSCDRCHWGGNGDNSCSAAGHFSFSQITNRLNQICEEIETNPDGTPKCKSCGGSGIMR